MIVRMGPVDEPRRAQVKLDGDDEHDACTVQHFWLFSYTSPSSLSSS